MTHRTLPDSTGGPECSLMADRLESLGKLQHARGQTFAGLLALAAAKVLRAKDSDLEEAVLDAWSVLSVWASELARDRDEQIEAIAGPIEHAVAIEALEADLDDRQRKPDLSSCCDAPIVPLPPKSDGTQDAKCTECDDGTFPLVEAGDVGMRPEVRWETWNGHPRLFVAGKQVAVGWIDRGKWLMRWSWGREAPSSPVASKEAVVAAIIAKGIAEGIEVPPFFESEGVKWAIDDVDADGDRVMTLAVGGCSKAQAWARGGQGHGWVTAAWGSTNSATGIEAPDLWHAVGEIIRRAALKGIGVPWPSRWPEGSGPPEDEHPGLPGPVNDLVQGVLQTYPPEEPERFWSSCTGCYEGGGYGEREHLYPLHPEYGCRVGAGCEECDGTGVVEMLGGPPPPKQLLVDGKPVACIFDAGDAALGEYHAHCEPGGCKRGDSSRCPHAGQPAPEWQRDGDGWALMLGEDRVAAIARQRTAVSTRWMATSIWYGDSYPFADIENAVARVRKWGEVAGVSVPDLPVPKAEGAAKWLWQNDQWRLWVGGQVYAIIAPDDGDGGEGWQLWSYGPWINKGEAGDLTRGELPALVEQVQRWGEAEGLEVPGLPEATGLGSGS